MKIIFVETPAPWLIRKHAQIALGPLYIATVLKKQGHEVSIARPDDLNELVCVKDYDIVCLSGTTLEYPMNTECAKWIKNKYPEKIIIIGGVHATVLAEEVSETGLFDVVVAGEAEGMIGGIIDNIEQGTYEKIYRCTQLIKNLDDIPIPDRSLIPGSHGSEIFANGRNYIGTSNENFITSRGCPFKCSFCASNSIWGRNVRFRSTANIMREIRYIIENFGIYQIRVCDDNITSDEKRCIELCDAIINSEFEIAWRCSVRPESLTKKMCEKMAESGCKEVSVGIESGDQRVLDYLDKNTTLEKMLVGCKNAKDAGMAVRALCMMGTPGEREDTPELTDMYLEKLPHDIVVMSTFVPLPGTAVWNDPEKYNCEILSKDFTIYNRDYFIFKNGEAKKREYVPLIHNKFLTLEEQIDNVARMEKYIEARNVNKGV